MLQSELQLVNEETGEVYELPAKETPFIPQVKNWLNYHTFPHVHELNTYPSLTVPDMSLSVTEILDRHSRGLGIEGMRVDIYEYDEEGNEIMQLPDLNQLDFAERVELLDEVRKQVSQLRDDLIKQDEGDNPPLEKKPTDEPLKPSENPLP